MRKVFMLFAVALVAFAGSVAPAMAAPSRTGDQPVSAAAGSDTYCAEPEEVAFLNLINQYRGQFGLGALQMSQTAGAAAEHHSVEMATANYFSHTLLNGLTWSQNMSNHGYTFNTYRGENIAAGNAGAGATFEQWRNSPGHNANMLNPSYNTIGIGRAYGGSSTYKYYWTTNFGGYRDAAAAICGQTAPTATTAASGSLRRGSTQTSTSAPSGGSVPTATPAGRTMRR